MDMTSVKQNIIAINSQGTKLRKMLANYRSGMDPSDGGNMKTQAKNMINQITNITHEQDKQVSGQQWLMNFEWIDRFIFWIVILINFIC